MSEGGENKEGGNEPITIRVRDQVSEDLPYGDFALSVAIYQDAPPHSPPRLTGRCLPVWCFCR